MQARPCRELLQDLKHTCFAIATGKKGQGAVPWGDRVEAESDGSEHERRRKQKDFVLGACCGLQSNDKFVLLQHRQNLREDEQSAERKRVREMREY